MRIRIISTFSVAIMLLGTYMYARSVQQVSYIETEMEESLENSWISAGDLEYLNNIMTSIDFSVQESPVNTAIYNSELDKEYKTAFLKVLFGQAPIQDEGKEEYYFGEIIPDLNEYSSGIEMGDFMNVRYYIAITSRLNYYYMDFDGDGLPELITHYIQIEDDQDFGGPYILKYNPEDKQVYRFASADAAKWEPLGSGKLYYDDSDNARYSYGYQEINALGEVSREIRFVPVYLSGGYVTVYIDVNDGTETSAKNVTLKRENWNQLERDFLKAADNAPTGMSFDALFHDIDVNELIAKIPPIFPNKIEHFAYDTDNAAFQSNGKQKDITYQVPLEEIAERIEYEYVYENMTDHIADHDYKQLSFLPSGEDIAISVYILEGNKILFLPEEKTNKEAIVNDEPCRLHYCEEADGYVFYILVDWQVSEDGIPVNSLENDYYYRIRECIVRDKDAVYEKTNRGDSPVYFLYEFDLEDLVKLGDTKVTFDPEQMIELPEIPLENNEYMDAVAEFAADILHENGIYGSFRIYPETYGRVQGQYVDYATRGKISAAIIGDGFEDYLFFEIGDGGEINGDQIWPTYYPARVDSPTYFVDQYFLQDEPEDFIEKIVGLQRGVIEMEVREGDDSEEETGGTPYVAPEYDQDIDFRTMSPEETAELISYVYSYGEWFGMNELGCMTGELRDLQDETIIMYTWKEGGGDNRVYFVPKSKVNTYLKFGDGEFYPVYVNKNEEMEFFYLERNEYAGGNGQLKTSYFIQDHGFSDLETRYSEAMVCLGEAELTLRELPSLDVPAIEEDEYVTAFKEHIEDMLRQNGKSGEYEMNIGEYEAPFINRVCLSAAVTGEGDSYYFRYLIVKSGQGNYYFWPAGFGLNGSLGECDAGRHYMNALCVARTEQLGRCSIVIEVIPGISEDIGDCKWVYDSWMEFDDEGQLPYASEETYQFIKAAYDEVDFIGEFKKGDLSLYDDYKNKYKRLIHNEVPFYDKENCEEVYINDFIDDFAESMEYYKYYFFDVDEDDAPELTVTFPSHQYVFDYDYETDEYAMWYPMEGWYFMTGSRKVLWWWEGMLCAYYQLDQKGEEECYTFFFQNVQGFNKPCLVMIPEYADDSKKVEIPEEMKPEGVYTRTGGHWYFRVTQEQYEELLNKYIEAYQLAEEKRQDVTYSYEELFSPSTAKTEKKCWNK